jgi:hypothetical protein
VSDRMAQVCSVMGEGLGLLPNRALSASVRRPSANDTFLPPRHKVYREYSARMIGHPLRVQPPSSGISMSSPSSRWTKLPSSKANHAADIQSGMHRRFAVKGIA